MFEVTVLAVVGRRVCICLAIELRIIVFEVRVWVVRLVVRVFVVPVVIMVVMVMGLEGRLRLGRCCGRLKIVWYILVPVMVLLLVRLLGRTFATVRLVGLSIACLMLRLDAALYILAGVRGATLLYLLFLWIMSIWLFCVVKILVTIGVSWVLV